MVKKKVVEKTTYQKSIATEFMKGATIGGVSGLALAYIWGKYYFILIVAGICVGGYVSTSIANTKKEIEKNKSQFQNFSSPKKVRQNYENK